MKKKLFLGLQAILPQHHTSRFVARLMSSRFKPLKTILISWFIRKYNIDLTTAQIANPQDYPTFNSFFTRSLKQELRPIDDAENSIISPADGFISQFGKIKAGKIFQAKGHEFNLLDLLAGEEERARMFANGEFITVYLSPKDYHRVHMPIAGELEKMTYVAGKLFSVNRTSVEHIPELFSRNERVVSFFNTAIGPMAIILVGAMLVAGIETIWHGVVAPSRYKKIKSWAYEKNEVSLQKGDEMGRFQFGSTVIVLFGEKAIRWENLHSDQQVQMGQRIGSFELNENVYGIDTEQ